MSHFIDIYPSLTIVGYTVQPAKVTILEIYIRVLNKIKIGRKKELFLFLSILSEQAKKFFLSFIYSASERRKRVK